MKGKIAATKDSCLDGSREVGLAHTSQLPVRLPVSRGYLGPIAVLEFVGYRIIAIRGRHEVSTQNKYLCLVPPFVPF